jgi:hypothetical protein
MSIITIILIFIFLIIYFYLIFYILFHCFVCVYGLFAVTTYCLTFGLYFRECLWCTSGTVILLDFILPASIIDCALECCKEIIRIISLSSVCYIIFDIYCSTIILICGLTSIIISSSLLYFLFILTLVCSPFLVCNFIDTFFCTTIYVFLIIYIPINDILYVTVFAFVCCIPTNYCCLPFTFFCIIFTTFVTFFLTLLWNYLCYALSCLLVCRTQFFILYLIVIIMIIVPDLICIIEIFFPFLMILVCTFILRNLVLLPFYCYLIIFSLLHWGA